VDEDEAITFVPLTRADFPKVVTWLAQPHVAEWWHRPQGTEAFEAEYGPSVDGTDPTLAFICTSSASSASGATAATPLAFVQMYRIDDEPAYHAAVKIEQAAGMDLFLVDGARCGTGLGPRVIRATVAKIWATYADVDRVVASPSVHNARSIKAFEKSGFSRRGPVTVPGEIDEELVMVRERTQRATAK
jgi:aminoglycoside 6'-N-acetyltransferase